MEDSGSSDENQLMDYIARYARVQSCIVNHDKRHAFLKLISHQDAINVKAAVDQRPETEYRHLFERVGSYYILIPYKTDMLLHR
jgi:hypothetical protein